MPLFCASSHAPLLFRPQIFSGINTRGPPSKGNQTNRRTLMRAAGHQPIRLWSVTGHPSVAHQRRLSVTAVLGGAPTSVRRDGRRANAPTHRATLHRPKTDGMRPGPRPQSLGPNEPRVATPRNVPEDDFEAQTLGTRRRNPSSRQPCVRPDPNMAHQTRWSATMCKQAQEWGFWRTFVG